MIIKTIFKGVCSVFMGFLISYLLFSFIGLSWWDFGVDKEFTVGSLLRVFFLGLCIPMTLLYSLTIDFVLDKKNQ